MPQDRATRSRTLQVSGVLRARTVGDSCAHCREQFDRQVRPAERQRHPATVSALFHDVVFDQTAQVVFERTPGDIKVVGSLVGGERCPLSSVRRVSRRLRRRTATASRSVESMTTCRMRAPVTDSCERVKPGQVVRTCPVARSSARVNSRSRRLGFDSICRRCDSGVAHSPSSSRRFSNCPGVVHCAEDEHDKDGIEHVFEEMVSRC